MKSDADLFDFLEGNNASNAFAANPADNDGDDDSFDEVRVLDLNRVIFAVFLCECEFKEF